MISTFPNCDHHYFIFVHRNHISIDTQSSHNLLTKESHGKRAETNAQGNNSEVGNYVQNMWYKLGSEVAQFVNWQGWSFLEVREQAVLIPVKELCWCSNGRRTQNNRERNRKYTESINVILRSVLVTILVVNKQ